MSKSYVIWPAVIIILLIAAGAIYFATQISAPAPTTPPAVTPTPSVVDTSELDAAATQNEQDFAEVEASLNDYESVDTMWDELEI